MISGDVLSLSKLTVVRFLQFENAPSPIAITLGGIVISFKSQPKKRSRLCMINLSEN